MCTDRRTFYACRGYRRGDVLGGDLINAAAHEAEPEQQREVPEAIRKLKPMTEGVVPITLDERRGRIAKAQRLMREQRIDAIYLEPGSSMFYFTGMRWGTSERMFALVIPARGEVAWVCPKFEEERARELIKIGDDVRTWEEDESPYKRVAEIFRDRGLRTGRIGMEERVRFFLFDGIRKAAPGFQYVSADSISAGCRISSRPRNCVDATCDDITIVAYKATPDSMSEAYAGEFSGNLALLSRAWS